MRTPALLVVSFLAFPCAFPQERATPQTAPAQSAAGEPAIIEGRVLNSLTGEPLRKASLTLMRAGMGSVGPAPPENRIEITDPEGKFRFENLQPGRYMLSGEKAGFVRQQYGSRAAQMGPGTALTLTAGQKLAGLEFKLTPQAVISGKVLDEDGEPLTRVSVQVLRKSSYAGRSVGMMGASTNDIGEFRLANLGPGTYVIRADYRRMMFAGAVRSQAADEDGVQDYVPTYYPGTTEADAAVPITVAAGQEVPGVTLRMQKARVYRVRGKVLGVGSDPSSRIQVSLVPQRRSGVMGMVFGGGGGAVRPDGTFELASVQPGSYQLTAMRFDTGRPQAVGRVPVTVTDRNLDGLIIQAGNPLQITGRLTIEGDEKPALQGSVVLQPAEGMSFGSSPGRIDAGGAFKIENVSRDKYYVSVFGLAEGLYVKRVNAAGRDVLESGLDLSQSDSAPPLEIVLSSKAAAVDGLVLQDGKPFPGAAVTLLPDPVQPERLRWTQRTATTDQSGRFTLMGISPGEYRLYAWEEYVPIAEMEPEQFKRYESSSVKLKLAEQAREQVELKAVRMSAE
jgi:protocatechuate 3,4-dioxygenase beta subunit